MAELVAAIGENSKGESLRFFAGHFSSEADWLTNSATGSFA